MSHESTKASYDPLLDEAHGAHGGEDHGEGNWLVSYADMMTLLVGFFVILLSFSTMDEQKFEEARKSVSKEFGGKFEMPYEELANRVREALKKSNVGNQIVVKTTNQGVEISFLGPVFFSPGSADIKDEARTLMDSLLEVVKTEANEFNFVVEGHTDDVPLMPGGTYRNNWELSSIRACRVLDFFFQRGFDKGHLTAIGYGDTRPVLPNRNEQGSSIPENQSQNRRVVIKMMKKETDVL